jgi:hypothetical protein
MMNDNEEIMRLREAFAAPDSAASNIQECPEPDRIWSAVRGELPADELREVLSHVALCASCAEDWRIAMAFEEEARQREEARVIPFHRYQRWVAAAAAALVLTVSGKYIHEWQKEQGPPTYRGEQTRIEAVVSTGEALPREAFVLAWKPVENAESYDLSVTDANLIVVAHQKGTSTTYQIPAGDLAALSPGAKLHWTVTAFDEDGGILSTATFTNRLE